MLSNKETHNDLMRTYIHLEMKNHLTQYDVDELSRWVMCELRPYFKEKYDSRQVLEMLKTDYPEVNAVLEEIWETINVLEATKKKISRSIDELNKIVGEKPNVLKNRLNRDNFSKEDYCTLRSKILNELSRDERYRHLDPDEMDKYIKLYIKHFNFEMCGKHYAGDELSDARRILIEWCVDWIKKWFNIQ